MVFHFGYGMYVLGKERSAAFVFFLGGTGKRIAVVNSVVGLVRQLVQLLLGLVHIGQTHGKPGQCKKHCYGRHQLPQADSCFSYAHEGGKNRTKPFETGGRVLEKNYLSPAYSAVLPNARGR